MSPLLRRVELDRIHRERSRRIAVGEDEIHLLCEALFFVAAGGLLILLAYVALVA